MLCRHNIMMSLPYILMSLCYDVIMKLWHYAMASLCSIKTKT